MAVEEIFEIVPAKEVREDAYWVTYKETEPPEDDEHNGMCKVLVTCKKPDGTLGDEMTVRETFLREYHKKWEVEWEANKKKANKS